MKRSLIERMKSADRNFLLFITSGIFLGIAQSVDGSTLTNFLKDKFDIVVMQRTMMEMPRELPGFLVFLVIGLLYALGDIRIAALANFIAAVGMFSLGIMPPHFAMALIVIFIYSMGQHVYMPLSNSIGMSFAAKGQEGRKLGQISAANTAALVASSAILWCLYKFLKIGFSTAFTIGAIALFISSVLLFCMKQEKKQKQSSRFVFRKQYRLYYWLSILFGARKQIFITFGPWVLVDVFHQKITTMTTLFFIVSVFSIIFRPLIGHLIDKLGEKFVLGGEAALLFFICLGYAFADKLFQGSLVIIVICFCYVFDQVLNAAGMARATYLKKIALRPEDVSPTLSLGISIDHIVSMFIPTLGGLVWVNGGVNGYKYVFLGGAFIALVNFISVRKITFKDNDNTHSRQLPQDAAV